MLPAARCSASGVMRSEKIPLYYKSKRAYYTSSGNGGCNQSRPIIAIRHKLRAINGDTKHPR